ncbi:HAD family hydrolase [Geobacter sp. DSM 9736]|uniref:HAD family hydrolase n=1 Tax=Geobacter sp. DSM 9736 TaxID=1277350 RepID=UPI001561267C|nr:HAD family hydrolase [Geobacter sp. DSM 9736]
MNNHIRSLIFDLDGTLYVSADLGRAITETACGYLADLKGISVSEAETLVARTRKALTERSGSAATLSQACVELGGDLRDLHHKFASELEPERFIRTDERVVELIRLLAGGFELFVYTNNNRRLAERIMKTIGVSGLFQRVFTIEETWKPKPDRETLEFILREIGRKPEECLFVGDRYDVDLRLPADLGCAVCLVKSVEELFPLCKLLHEESL